MIGDVEIGFDEKFETRWWRTERIAWTIMLVLVALGLSGVFGRGPLSKRTAGSPSGPVQIDYERFTRFRTPTALTVHLARGAMRDSLATIWLGRDLTDGSAVQRVVPEPERAEPDDGGTLYTFAAPANTDSTTVRFFLEPGKTGPQHGHIAIPGVQALEIPQFIYP
jgi:hypothetical protein